MRRDLVMVVGLLMGCPGPSPEPKDCDRDVIDDSFADFLSTDVVTRAGEPVELEFFSPLSICPTDTLGVRIEGSGPDTISFPLELSSPPLAINHLVAQARATFTPPTPGLFIVRAAFEPSLGVRTKYVIAARAPPQPLPGVELPSACAKPWPLSTDTIACEGSARGTVELQSSDGGTISFDGTALVTAGSVLWSVTRFGTLERRVFMDGGLELTNRFPSVSSAPLNAEQGPDFALRLSVGGRPFLFLADGGVVEKHVAGPNELSWWVHGEQTSTDPCQVELCTGAVVASDPSAIWFRDNDRLLQIPRPVPAPNLGVFRFGGANRFTRPRPGLFERIPLWLTTPQGAEVLVTMDRGGPEAVALPRSEVLNVNRDFIVLRTADGGVTIAPR